MDPEATAPILQTEEAPATTEEAPATSLPEGWEHAVSPVDGKEYYYNASTGATSWTHPSLPGAAVDPSTEAIDTAPSLGDFSGIIANRTTEDYGKDIEEGDVYTKMTDYDPAQPIRAHRCYSFIALILFFPLGAIAICKSRGVVSKYNRGEYEKAHDSSQQALLFSRISCIIGALFWSYFAYCYFAGPAAPWTMDIPQEWWADVDMQKYKDQVRDYFSSETAEGEE